MPMKLNEMLREQVREVAPYATLVIPTGAIEQHGPHLPMATDCAIAEGISLRAAQLAAKEIPVVLGPMLPLGYSDHHLFAATLSLHSETYLRVLKDLTSSAVTTGFRRIFFVNAHGGNDELIRIAARDLVLEAQAAVGVCSYWTVARQALEALRADHLGQIPGHAGNFETALMMALNPALVRIENLPHDTDHPTLISHLSIAPGLLVVKAGEWQRIQGYSEAPLSVSAEYGHTLLSVVVPEVSRAIVAFHRAVGTFGEDSAAE